MSARYVDWRPSPARYPFASRWLDGGPGRMHYLDEGRGRPILLLHGNPTWSFLYRKLIPPLAAGGLRCVAPDSFGFGLSAHPDGFGYTAAEQAAAILELVTRLDLGDLLLMGQDWGGPLALWVAAQAPERVAGVVLGNTFGWPMAGLVMKLMAALVHTRFAYRYVLRKDRFVARVMRGMVRAPLTDEEVEHYQQDRKSVV